MAATKYLSEFYTTKALLPVSYGPVVADPNTALERQIQAHVLRGNQLYFTEKYASALGEYLAAWGLIPRLIDIFFPSDSISISPDVLLKLDLTKELLTASADIHMFRDLAGPLAPLGGPGDPHLLHFLHNIELQFGMSPRQYLQWATQFVRRSKFMMRRCLLCGEFFPSLESGDRHCRRCKGKRRSLLEKETRSPFAI